MSESVRYRIWCDREEDEWVVDIIRNGEWAGGCGYDTGAEAIAAYNEKCAKKAATK